MAGRRLVLRQQLQSLHSALYSARLGSTGRAVASCSASAGPWRGSAVRWALLCSTAPRGGALSASGLLRPHDDAARREATPLGSGTGLAGAVKAAERGVLYSVGA